MIIINTSLHSNENGLTLPKQKQQLSVPTFSSMCAHPTTLQKKGANKNLSNMSFNGF